MTSLAEEIEKMINSSPALKFSSKSYGQSWTLCNSGVLNIYGNLVSNELIEQVNPNDVSTIQFARKFDVENETLNQIEKHLLRSNQSIHLNTVFNGCGAFDNLDFVKHLPTLESLAFQSFNKIDINPITEFLKLKDLKLGGYNIALQSLKGYSSLKKLWIGDKIKDYSSISHIPNIEDITLMSQNIKSLEFLNSMQKLSKISVLLGGTSKFDELAKIKSLKYLDLWRIKSLEIEDLKTLNQISKLDILKLRELPRISKLDWLEIPSLSTLVLQQMKGLISYESLSKICRIENLIILDKLNKDKVDSFDKLDNISTIQILPYYFDNKNHFVHNSKSVKKLKRIDLKEQI